MDAENRKVISDACAYIEQNLLPSQYPLTNLQTERKATVYNVNAIDALNRYDRRNCTSEHLKLDQLYFR